MLLLNFLAWPSTNPSNTEHLQSFPIPVPLYFSVRSRLLLLDYLLQTSLMYPRMIKFICRVLAIPIFPLPSSLTPVNYFGDFNDRYLTISISFFSFLRNGVSISIPHFVKWCVCSHTWAHHPWQLWLYRQYLHNGEFGNICMIISTSLSPVLRVLWFWLPRMHYV